ncbi:pyridoxal phosphate-dependent aminotransferase [Clostridium cellulovorans]|uniref:Aminotransferase n=1 Tax=Clostridium cellulovorans (strain ATCC 35296 / DSM 3052 / OCM 3 / 743B) TaxID=573061 RepID=D9SM71_CLOC7|nr:pyridoxal phosphate-dependent aminotransferase [Clostridium cellulovorans]ADL51802.1 aminotransferase class I and II [Clostridium cellulovorans 743B]
MKLSEKALSLGDSVTLQITSKANELKAKGVDIVGFGVGEPDFPTPENIKNAAIRAINENKTRYTAASGLPELKKSVACKFLKENNLKYDSSQIVISTGAKQCLSNAFAAILNPGDEVILVKPYWVTYPELIKLYGGVPVILEGNEANDYKLVAKEVNEKITDKTKAILINSPNNPTGSIYYKEDLQALADLAKEKDLFIISDEIYEKLIYDKENHISIASLSEDSYNRTIVINGVSKSYAMTGWRMGYSASNIELAKVMSKIQSHTTSNPTTITQYATIEALTGPQNEIEVMVKEFEARRNYMCELINDINNISYISPKGAFYIMINISTLFGKSYKGIIINSAQDFSKHLLDNYYVAVVPGEAFGDEKYIRLSYAASKETILKGLTRIKDFIKELA